MNDIGADHLAMHGHMWIPMQTGIQEQYAALEEELMPGDRSNSFDDNMEKSSLDGVDTSKLDAKTLARLKNRDQAKKSREKKKRAIEGMTDELADARKKLKDQSDFLSRAQEKLKQYEEMVETNRKLAEENLRLQAILFPDPNDPLAMAVPGSVPRSMCDLAPTSDSGVMMQLAHEFIDFIQNGASWENGENGEGGIEMLTLDEDCTFRCDTMPKCVTIKDFADCMEVTTKVIFSNFHYVRKSSTCDKDEVTVVCMSEGDHVAKGPAAPSDPPKRMSCMTVFSFRFCDTKHEGKKIENLDVICDTHTMYCQLGWPLVCFLKPKARNEHLNAGLNFSAGRGFKMVPGRGGRGEKRGRDAEEDPLDALDALDEM